MDRLLDRGGGGDGHQDRAERLFQPGAKAVEILGARGGDDGGGAHLSPWDKPHAQAVGGAEPVDQVGVGQGGRGVGAGHAEMPRGSRQKIRLAGAAVRQETVEQPSLLPWQRGKRLHQILGAHQPLAQERGRQPLLGPERADLAGNSNRRAVAMPAPSNRGSIGAEG
ncbi:hypothetical protein MASR1M32_35670 [Rhodobacter sp.]